MSPTTPEPAQPTTKQLGWTYAVAAAAVILWLLAIVAVIADEVHALHAPLVNLCIGLAVAASSIAVMIGLDYRRRTEAEVRHQALVEKIEQVAHDSLTEALAPIADVLSRTVPPEALAAIRDLNERIAAGPTINSASVTRLPRPARSEG